jgi:hypothetical protein
LFGPIGNSTVPFARKLWLLSTPRTRSRFRIKGSV